jgi:hypothetical protein
MINELFIVEPYAQTKRLRDYVSQSGVRFYGYSPDLSSLQIRVRSNKPQGDAGTIATAHLSLADLKRLRDAIDAEIGRLTAEMTLHSLMTEDDAA